ncbi:winged helix-turn-helix transcriptional regulator [Gordonia soli]|uniref:winged helix-turn-helix transcriptional regulator n=1 Tax=Gordonia soli TaxID=320799 RepID=UPI003F72C395
MKHLGEGSRRFNELGRLVPLANTKTLTRQLRELEEDGIVRRTVYQEVPPKVEYSLTELGRTLEPLVVEMDSWGALFSAQLSGDAARDADGARASADRSGSEARAEGSVAAASVGWNQ